MEKTQAFTLSLLITLLIASNFYLFSKTSFELETAKISRIIDGDTLELEDGRTIRLVNINAPEKSNPKSTLSSDYLEQFINQTIQLEVLGAGKYGRVLGRIYSPSGTYINLELVSQGLASKFLVENSELSEFAKAEDQAIHQRKGIWKRSQYSTCLSTEINEKQERIIITNHCNKINMLDFTLKDESRKNYKFRDIELNNKITLHTTNGTDNQTDIFWNSKTNIWNNDRDSLYIFDSKGDIIHHNSYG